MSDAWAGVAAGFGGSAITGAISLAIVERQARHARRDRRHSERRKAYSELLGYSILALQNIQSMHLTMAVRSGLPEGVNVTLGIREPMDPMKLWEAIRADFGPLMLAWSDTWTSGSQEGIRLANKLIDRCSAVMTTGTAQGDARGRIASLVAGQKWSQEQLDSWAADVKAAAAARRDLALFARRELGYEVAEMFTEVPGNDA